MAESMTLTLDGAPVELEFSSRALSAIDRQFGDMQTAHEAVEAKRSFAAMKTVIELGANMDQAAAKGLQGRIYRTGLSRLVMSLREYLWRLECGGEPIEDVLAALNGQTEDEADGPIN